jgi:pimeloyl-ACP methyl ester carboxylesterase
VHRAGFEVASDEVFAVVRQFYDFDEALPLDARVVDSWEDETARFETVVFTTSSGERVPGDLTLPLTGEPPYPAVLLIHGLNSTRDYWWRPDREALPKGLLAAGIAVMTIDLRFHGARSAANDYLPPALMTMGGNELFVRSRDMTIQSAIDSRRALDFLGEQPEIDGARIGVAGYSMGAMIALYLSALEGELVAAVGAAVPTRTQQLPTDHFNFAARATMPVLLQIGRDDWLSSPADAEMLRGLVPRELGKLRYYDAGHRLPPAFASDAAAWLVERLAPPA